MIDELRSEMRRTAKHIGSVRKMLRAMADTGEIPYATAEAFYYGRRDSQGSTLRALRAALDAMGRQAA